MMRFVAPSKLAGTLASLCSKNSSFIAGSACFSTVERVKLFGDQFALREDAKFPVKPRFFDV